MSKLGLPLDERNRAILGRICTILYLITIYSLLGDMLYRQLALHQNPSQFEDIAVILTANVLGFIALILYFGGVTVGKFSFGKIVAGYFIFLTLGMTFTMIKYRGSLPSLLIDKAVTVFTICTIMAAAVVVIAWLGKRRIDREIE
jgi:hypothetical protein